MFFPRNAACVRVEFGPLCISLLILFFISGSLCQVGYAAGNPECCVSLLTTLFQHLESAEQAKVLSSVSSSRWADEHSGY